jgi:hypothetical protein
MPPATPFPTAPELPRAFEEAPQRLNSRDLWDGVEAGQSVEVGEWVADVQLRECLWSRAELVGRRFTGLVCRDVRFVGCDLAGASPRTPD